MLPFAHFRAGAQSPMDHIYTVVILPLAVVFFIVMAAPDGWLERVTRPWRKR